jgi:hypothetical protein
VAVRLSTVVKRGDIRESLEAIRDKLAIELEMSPGREAAAVAKQLLEVMSALDALPKAEESGLDQLAAARAARRQKAASA